MTDKFSSDFIQRLTSLAQSHAALCTLEERDEETPNRQSSYRFVLELGGFLADRFQPEISETAYNRLLAKHKGHCHQFEVNHYYTVDVANGRRYDLERHVQSSQQQIEVFIDQEWGLNVSIIHASEQEKEKEQPSNFTNKEWKKRTSFMLDTFLRLDLIQLQTTTRGPQRNEVRETFQLQMEYLVNAESLMGSSKGMNALLPALYSVLQILQNSCIPLPQSRRSLIHQSFTALTGFSMNSFPYAEPALLQRRTLQTMFHHIDNSGQPTPSPPSVVQNGGYLVTDKAADATPSLIYLFENTVYMYCNSDRLRQITQPNMDIRKWNHSVFVGEYGDHFQAADVTFFQGQNWMGNAKKTTTDRLDSLTMCHNDLAVVYGIPPFGLKRYSFCHTAAELSEAIREIFDTFECRGPYTIEGLCILDVNAAYPPSPDSTMPYASLWQRNNYFTLQFANSVMDHSLYASGPHDTICPIDGLQVSQNLFPGRLAIFQFHDIHDNTITNPSAAIECEFLNLDTDKQQPDMLSMVQEKCENFRLPLTRTQLLHLSTNDLIHHQHELPRLFTTSGSPSLTTNSLQQQQQRENETMLFRSIMIQLDDEDDNEVKSTTPQPTKPHPLQTQGGKKKTQRPNRVMRATTALSMVVKKRKCVPLLVTPVARKKLSLESLDA